MVKICPKCGTRDPDDGALFCHTCGNRLPPRIPEKTGILCPRCGTLNTDMQAVFCNTCGSPLQSVPPGQVPATGARPAAAPPAMKKSRCPSCGAFLAEENRYYCDACGAYLRGAARPVAARENTPASSENTGPAPPVTDRPDDDTPEPVPEKSRGPLLKWGLMAGAAAIVFILIAAVFSGLIPETSHPANTTPALQTQSSPTVPTTQKTLPAKTPAPSPVKTTPTPVRTTVAPTTVSTTRAANASATNATNTSVNGTMNASVTATTTLPITSASQLLSVGETAFDGKGNLTVNGFSFKDKMTDPTPSYAIGKQYLIVSITYQNLQIDTTIDADLTMVNVTDGGGYTYELASDILLEKPFTGTAIPPREKRTGNLLFIVPPQATYLKLHYTSQNQTGPTFLLT
jgi:hypothetical protein